jgi:formylglycine-generating enzyme required for sulfatase activity
MQHVVPSARLRRFAIALTVASATVAAAAWACNEEPRANDTGAIDAADSAQPAGCEPEVRADCDDDSCRIPAGCFRMGAPESEWGSARYADTQVEVRLTRPFAISRYEVTRAQWAARGLPLPTVAAVAGFEICEESECPVVSVGWYEALAFANAASDAEGLPRCYVLERCVGELGSGMTCSAVRTTTPELHDCEGYRLPTEAEWEYAARAGTTTAFYSGEITAREQTSTCGPDENLERIGWYCHNSAGRPHPVGGKEPNAFGLYDVAGNAEEWVSDPYTAEGYGAGPLSDPGATLDTAGPRVTRGGAFFLWSEAAKSSRRSSSGPEPGVAKGLRLARTLAE